MPDAPRTQPNSRVGLDNYRDLTFTAVVVGTMDKDLKLRLWRFFNRTVLVKDRTTVGQVLDTLRSNGDYKPRVSRETAAELADAIEPEFMRLAEANAERMANRGGGGGGGGGPRRFLVVGTTNAETTTLRDLGVESRPASTNGPAVKRVAKRKGAAKKAAPRRRPVTT